MLDAIIVGQVIQRVREEKRMSQELSLAMGIRPSALLKEIENEVELQKAE